MSKVNCSVIDFQIVLTRLINGKKACTEHNLEAEGNCKKKG